ncbi:MAG: VOC family protein [Vicinamibacterales bacterium]
MESIIAKLLKDFEDGRMSRRDLIRSLAMAAAAVPAAGLIGQAEASTGTTGSLEAMAAASPWKTTWLDHISYQVSDYKKSSEFYASLMGWEPGEDTGSQVTMKIGDVGGIIIRNRRRPGGGPGGGPGAPGAGAGPGAGQGRGPQGPVTGVIDHVSWGVTPWDKDTVKAELERRGLNPRPDFQDGGFESYHVKDPDGWDLQISNVNSKAKA